MGMDKQINKLKLLRAGKSEKFFINSKFHEKIEEQPLGLLNLPTGKIVANDPLCIYETEPFEKAVKPGQYPVFLYVQHIQDDRRVAFAEIRFTESSPVYFEPALIKGQDAEKLSEDEYYGYGVDSGTGGFMDELTCGEFTALIGTVDDGMIPELEKALDDSYVYTYSAANYNLPGTDNNLTVFSSGYGDGCYASYWGYDKNHELCCLITDFDTIDDEEWHMLERCGCI
ncbi:DUF4241 domain-containing protein [Lacrimispora indolis]|uniref:DUF4241 domain-containing protein n=1 Tax=Lacrimispora indolis TaxID=69825 RepID=UPI00045E5EB0|nr:DUF4241 domain-containing protein [Lacrimispora indolis]